MRVQDTYPFVRNSRAVVTRALTVTAVAPDGKHADVGDLVGVPVLDITGLAVGAVVTVQLDRDGALILGVVGVDRPSGGGGSTIVTGGPGITVAPISGGYNVASDLSEDAGNALAVRANGLYVPTPATPPTPPAPADVAPPATASAGVVGTSSDYAREDHTHAGPQASSTTPAAVGAVGAIGSGTTWAKADHVHAGAQPASTVPPAVGAGAVGVSTLYARGDHTHSASLGTDDRPWVISRAGHLITNGSAYLKDATNFPGSTYDADDRPQGTSGSFYLNGTNTCVLTDLIAVDVNRYYYVGGWFRHRNGVPAGGAACYIGLRGVDIDGLEISPSQVSWQAGTTTTLATELKAGDTVVHLTSAANWNNTNSAAHLVGFLFWNYVDGTGYVWPQETYSRQGYLNMYSPGAVVGNDITLNAPWAGPTFPAGHPVSNSTSGASYLYTAWAGNLASPTWQYRDNKTAPIGGGVHSGPAAPTVKFPYGTTSARMTLFTNSAGAQVAVAGVFMQEVAHSHPDMPTGADAVPPAIATAGAIGTSPQWAHEDHTHAGAQPAATAPPDIAGASVLGVSTLYARQDHTHGAVIPFRAVLTADTEIAGTTNIELVAFRFPMKANTSYIFDLMVGAWGDTAVDVGITAGYPAGGRVDYGQINMAAAATGVGNVGGDWVWRRGPASGGDHMALGIVTSWGTTGRMSGVFTNGSTAGNGSWWFRQWNAGAPVWLLRGSWLMVWEV